MDLEGIDLDERVRHLVVTLNRIPGVDTFSSCGGHSHPTTSQASEGEFYANLDVERNKEGWRALELISWAVSETDLDRLRLTVWTNGDEPVPVSFEIRGWDHADPDELADLLLLSLTHPPGD